MQCNAVRCGAVASCNDMLTRRVEVRSTNLTRASRDLSLIRPRSPLGRSRSCYSSNRCSSLSPFFGRSDQADPVLAPSIAMTDGRLIDDLFAPAPGFKCPWSVCGVYKRPSYPAIVGHQGRSEKRDQWNGRD
ncbi:hypothetical protein GE21DRAFT_1343656 [Neurospora crassa]|nr:hypothetical protein B14D6.70 [imported] - Neurospora crassa [Neurospora crassa]KHE87606.1 hypothetical protein GE21DRAFT_1343656 [Neurospora crassa]